LVERTGCKAMSEQPTLEMMALENIIGVLDDTMDTMNKSEVLRNNLVQQQIEIEKQISVLEGQLQRQKEYLAKIEGGLDVLDELKK